MGAVVLGEGVVMEERGGPADIIKVGRGSVVSLLSHTDLVKVGYQVVGGTFLLSAGVLLFLVLLNGLIYVFERFPSVI